jgi:gamma-glutamyltranspeptidase/glutathione hydrolase/leukotriene-C4 hydrolase
LKEGGTATDAGIATTLCIGTTNMFSSGIGGGGFLVIKPSPAYPSLNPLCLSPITIDFRETAPAAATTTMFTARREDPDFDPVRASKVGGLASGGPGELKGLEEAYRRCGGGVSWQRLLQPAADIARISIVGKEVSLVFQFFAFSSLPRSWVSFC